MDAESVTQWLGQLRAGDPAAAQKLWERYFQRLVRLARRRLRDVPRRAADEEDVAQSAFKSFCLGVQQGRFPQLSDRHNLWLLLLAILEHKAADLVQHDRWLKRGGGKVQGESAVLGSPEPGGDGAGLDQFLGREPTPAFAAQVSDEFRRLLDRLDDPQLQAVAVWKMEGYSNAEIAGKLGRSLPTVERKLQRIRHLWQDKRGP
jgi:DNA-directed RNA polymerase specialized sigma24 family protein